MHIFRLLFVLLAIAVVANASARQDPAPVKQAIENFLRIQIKGLPGQVSFSIGAIEPNNQLVPCPSFDVTMPPAARPWGRTQVSVRCQAEGGWRLFVPVYIKVSSHYLVTARPLGPGQVLQAADIVPRSGDLGDMPAGILTEPAQAIGRTLTMPLGAGRPLRGDMLRQAIVVLQNQSVKVVASGTGFAVANEGRALTNAVEGQVVQVRLANGQMVSGVAKSDGTVEVNY